MFNLTCSTLKKSRESHEAHTSVLMQRVVNNSYSLRLYSMSNYIETLFTGEGKVNITICKANKESMNE